MNSGNDKLSVLIVVYDKDSSDFFSQAIDSLIRQSRFPDEIIIVKNGPLNFALESVIESFLQRYPTLFKSVNNPTNVGLGNALNAGLQLCSNELVARMDADDICNPMRFEKQIAYMSTFPDISVLGCSIEEFQTRVGDKNTFRILPPDHKSLVNFSIYRNPINHPTVMFKKQAILDVGSYEDIPYFEDYFLWLKVLNNGGIIANMSECLLYFRANNNMFLRRHGIKYANFELKFLLKIYKQGYINILQLIVNIFIKIPIRLLPISNLKVFYSLFLRKNKTPSN